MIMMMFFFLSDYTVTFQDRQVKWTKIRWTNQNGHHNIS